MAVASLPYTRLLLLLLVLALLTLSPLLLVEARKNDNDDNNKSLRICTLAGGLDAVRLTSVPLRQVFEGALKDVELIRHHVVDSARSRGDTARPLLSMEELSQTLDWQARNMSNTDTTVMAGIGYADDRPDRIIEKFVTTSNEPFVGNKTTDLAMVETAATILPWLMDRTKFNEDTSPSSSATNNMTAISKDQRSLYMAAWIGSYGEAWLYYPPHQTTILGNFSSHELAFVQPNLPPAVIDKPYLTAPYPDFAVAGHMLITALAPIYYRGKFMGYQYQDSLEAGDDSPSNAAAAGRTPLGTYVASTGVDISVASVSSKLLENLRGTITPGSFAMVVGAEELNTVLISQATVEKIYPTRTGMEEERVMYFGTMIRSDRRNQTYQVSDTLVEPLTQLENADWKLLGSLINELQPGDRSFTTLSVTLTGQQSPTSFHVFYERWPDVADWATLLFVPKEELESSVVVNVVEPPTEESLSVTMNAEETTHTNATTNTRTQVVLENKGSLDVHIEIDKIPSWLSLDQEILLWSLPAGEELTLHFDVNLQGDISGYSGVIALKVQDANEQDNCYYEDILTINAHLTVVHQETLEAVRPYGLALSAITVLSALGWSAWVIWNASHLVVRASQPLFLHMMCTGIIFMGLSLIPLSIDDTAAGEEGCDNACMAFPWLLCLGFSISFSALFSKVRRINMIVANTKQYRRVTVSIGDVMVPFIVICSLNVTILSIWTAVDPLVWVRDTQIEDNHQGGLVASTGYCAFSEGRFAILCSVLLLLVNFIAVLMSLIQLYRARELSATYSEGKHIAMAMGSIMQAFLSGIPVLATVTDNPKVAYLVMSTIVFIVTMSLLTLTFLPKYFARQQDQALRPVLPRVKGHVPSESASGSNPAGTRESFTERREEQPEPDALPAPRARQTISDLSMPTFASESHEGGQDGTQVNSNSSSWQKHHAQRASSWTLPTVRETFVDEDDDEVRSCLGIREKGMDSPPTQPKRLKSEVELEVRCSTGAKERISSKPPVRPERVLSCLETQPEEDEEEGFQCHDGQNKRGLPPPTSHVTAHSEVSDVSSMYTMPEMYYGRRLYPDVDSIEKGSDVLLSVT